MSDASKWGQDELCAICRERDGLYPVRMQTDSGRWRTVVICNECWPKWKAAPEGTYTFGVDGT